MAPGKSVIREILPHEFTDENFGRLAQTADAKCKPPRRFNPEHYFPTMKQLMEIDMAKAWTNEARNAFLVALFSRNIFSGDNVGLVQFWVSSGADNQASLDLLAEFQAEAARRGCAATYASAFRNYRTAGMTRLFRRLGYEPHEMGFVKML